VDREAVARNVSQEPWVARAHVRRELPSTLVIDVVEREAACAVAFGSLYLADGDGNVFKRATPDEVAGLPVVTGIARDDYVSQPDHAREQLHQALRAIAGWRARADGSARPALGEVHVDRIAGVTLYTDRGAGVRLGVVDDTLPARLARYDAVAAALQEGGEAARLVYVDNRARPDRVTVKLASAQMSAHSGSRE
ncbi:MAG TPA: cell division protein FtsQ/DivIB, partial [Polyangia bacterium]